jgi:predicted transcriptional regulator
MIITGEYLKTVRKEKNVTQKELAEMAEISQAHIAKIENGKVDPRLSTVNRLLYVLQSLEKQETSRDVMKKSIISASPGTPVIDIIHMIKESGVSQVPIFDGESNIGSVRETTLINNIGSNLTLKEAKDIMDKPFPVIDADDPVESVKSLLDFHPAVLVSDKGKMAGIITKTDLL